MGKSILGLDLGTTSIGFAHVYEDELNKSNSKILKLGVRVNPLTVEELSNFEKGITSKKTGKPVTENAKRTNSRQARRRLDRFQLRRKYLREVLLNAKIINEKTPLNEDGKNSTHSTYKIRAKAAEIEVPLSDFAKVLFAINKKRGYKSSRKAKSEDEGQAIDSMAIAKSLYESSLTPGQYVYKRLVEKKNTIPDFYRSDLKDELDKIWTFQSQFHPELLTPELKKELEGKGQKATVGIFWHKFQLSTAENKGKREEKRNQTYKWRNDAVEKELTKEELAFVIAEVNNNISSSSGYLGAISDRSKELFFNKETVGQNLYKQLVNNRHTSLKNQIFYRQDYLDEFEQIWETQSKYHPELTTNLKSTIRDVVIFYQRKLKSQKGLISLCEFENKTVDINKDGKVQKKKIGLRVAPKSSPVFQEFKIWQILNNLEAKLTTNGKKNIKEIEQKQGKKIVSWNFDLIAKQTLFSELNIKGSLKEVDVLKILGYDPKNWGLNYEEIDGNQTNESLYNAFFKILEIEGYDVRNEFAIKVNKDDVYVSDSSLSGPEINSKLISIFTKLDIDARILNFTTDIEGGDFEKQPSYQLWHLLYSYEGDDSKSGNEKLINILHKKFGFKEAHGRILSNISLTQDYGSLSTKAMRKIMPYIKESKYSDACKLAGYNHSSASLSKEELETRILLDKLEILPKNSLRNPVVEKILNQMINVVNTLLDNNSKKDHEGKIIETFKFDEIRIELARELKKNAEERAEMTTQINASKKLHEKISKILQVEFGIKNPTRNDIIRYKLYEELRPVGYKDLYTNTYIPREILFSKQIDIDHIIPQSRVFDDSFSNKTITYRQENLTKGNMTAIDYIESKYGTEKAQDFVARVESLYNLNKPNNEFGINKAKYLKLLKRGIDIGEGFIERDLRDSQYIAKKAKEMLFTIARNVVTTTGSITERLREDWDLVNVMQELNFEKYKKLGLTEKIEKKDGSYKERIVDWTKRNDHRHHAMDALTVAFTKHNHIQYLNYLNARTDENNKLHYNVLAIENKETECQIRKDGSKKRRFIAPMPNFREEAKEHLEGVLISFKSKNKVVTKNKNEISSKTGKISKIELTPRGQLHKETVYGKYQFYETKLEKIGGKFDEEMIELVTKPLYKDLLLKRLTENGNDPKKAFTGQNALSKKPIFLDENKTQVMPESVKTRWLTNDFSIRKDITPENFKDLKTIEKVLDARVKNILLQRLQKFGNAKDAFSDLDKNPIWLNEEKGISIKRVTISGVNNAEPLHIKRDHYGKPIIDKNGKEIPTDYVSTGNNHHVAIYKDEKGKLQEKVVSFFEATVRVNQGLAIIDKNYNEEDGWQFLFTLKQNEYFIFPNEKTGFDPTEIDLMDSLNYKVISPNLFRVQKISAKNYVFTHHLETKAIDSDILKSKKELSGITYNFIQSPGKLQNIIKVRINHIGEIVKIGEY
ncbi:MAG: type II CRISPR RNA-guided endonuclease Cas9 [Saprospiraceae bacterium]|nr:type II CRISPR RNA-guided endonuclease Cas9 [Saprospiraceae bacterium]